MATRLLIVDDEVPLLRNLASYLESFESEFVVTTTPSAEEALSVIEFDPQIEVVLTDVRLPGLDGIELVRRITALDRNISILVMTAFSSVNVHKSATEAGALRYLEKPMDMKQLRKVLLEVVEARAGWSGSIGGLDIFDFTQLFLLSKKSTTAQVSHGPDTGVLIFRKGSLVHASTGALSGDQAFFAMASWHGGTFEEMSGNGLTGYEPNITSSTNHLMMEAARLRDEEHHKHDEIDDIFMHDDVENPGRDNRRINRPKKEEHTMAIKDHLTDFEDIEGFKGAAVFTSNGEMLEGLAKGKTDIKTVGMFANNALLNAQKATDQMGVGRGNMMQIRAPQAVVLMRCLNEATDFAATKEGKAHFHTVVVMDPEGNTGMASMLLDRAVGKIAEEMH